MARKRILFDTSVLIRHWHKSRAESSAPINVAAVEAWARRLIDFYNADAIVTPVIIEVVAGVRNAEELKLTRAYLATFRNIDKGRILVKDWAEARRITERVPRGGRPRDLGDCLIRAIARRLGYTVQSFDAGFRA